MEDLFDFVVVFSLMVGLGTLTACIASRKGGHYVGWSYYGLVVPVMALPHAVLKKATTPAPTLASDSPQRGVQRPGFDRDRSAARPTYRNWGIA